MEVEILVEGEGLAEIAVISLSHGCILREIVVTVAAKGGFEATDGVLFIEDEEVPLDLEMVLDDGYDHKRVHHVHRANTVEVVIHYGGKEDKKRAFSPSTRVERVLAWALGADGFNIDPAMAPEMELSIEGQTEELPGSAHIGRFVKHPHHRLELNLIRGAIMNGGAL